VQVFALKPHGGIRAANLLRVLDKQEPWSLTVRSRFMISSDG